MDSWPTVELGAGGHRRALDSHAMPADSREEYSTAWRRTKMLAMTSSRSTLGSPLAKRAALSEVTAWVQQRLLP